jgi:hypothetical protein
VKKYFAVVGAYDEGAVVWSVARTDLDYHLAYLAAGQTAVDSGDHGFFVSEFESTRTKVAIIIFHWQQLLPLDLWYLRHSFDAYLDMLENDNIALEFDENSN